jgi:hypothetical protein
MKSFKIAVLLSAVSMFAAVPALADNRCSIKAVVGKWIFATGVGHQMLGPPFPDGKNITAIGTLNIDRHGNLSGQFDATVQDFTFLPAIAYNGAITVNKDCTGTVTFITSVGTMRTDSIAVISRDEMLGMSQDPANLWTYQVRRISSRTGKGRDD